jgi:hypothetical protein
MQPIPYRSRSSFFPAIEAALDAAGDGWERLIAHLGPRGYERDELIQVPGPEPEVFLSTWRGDPDRFSARIRAAASVLHGRGFRGTLRATHENGVLTLHRRGLKAHKRPEGHEWHFAGVRVTALTFDASSIRLEAWWMDGTIVIRVSTAFAFSDAGSSQVMVDPEISSSGAPLLPLVGARIDRLAIAPAGGLTAEFDDSRRIEVAPHATFEAWEASIRASGNSVGYLCMAGGGKPWR